MKTTPGSVSICPPSIRLVAVVATAALDEAAPGGWRVETTFHPVLALSARHHEDGGVDYDALIVSPDPVWGVQPASTALDWLDSAHQVVAAPWAAEGDAEMLAGVAADLENRAVREAADRLGAEARRELASPAR